ncbi:hypothetical protein X824_gp245 [Escherichia phage 4MG]|uniref:Hyphothetical protein n=1 Tax=Escherichia phage 4MG TaxID=1391428 RepID=V5KSV6_9CAUD|nr:hypothetical protein X824_gp245 [Escherichia phage 4MG]AGZ17578.1 hyphothetical protein [Escherichia phage 4MG]
MTLMSIKNKLDRAVSIITRLIIGLSVFIFLFALIIFVNWVIETLGGKVIFGGILLIIAVIGCYGVGCSIYPHKEKGEK